MSVYWYGVHVTPLRRTLASCSFSWYQNALELPSARACGQENFVPEVNVNLKECAYLNDRRADIFFLHNNRLVRGTVGELGRVVVDILDLYDDDASTAATRRASAATTVVRCRDVQTIRAVRLVQCSDQCDDA